MTAMHTADPLAITSLILTAIGAVAACIAAYFSWKAPSKKDLERVEQNTAVTSDHLENVQSHLASINSDLKRVEGNTAETSEHLGNVHRSLKSQEERDALNNKAQRVSMTATGYSEVNSTMQMTISVADREVVLTQVGLYNEQENYFGSFKFATPQPPTWKVNIPPPSFQNWFNSGTADQLITRNRVKLRVYMSHRRGKSYIRTSPLLS